MFGLNYKQESGAIVIDGNHVASTSMCVHCGAHVMTQANTLFSAKKRKTRWCLSCGGTVCLRQNCLQCIPYEAKLDYSDAIAQNHLREVTKLLGKYPDIARIGL